MTLRKFLEINGDALVNSDTRITIARTLCGDLTDFRSGKYTDRVILDFRDLQIGKISIDTEKNAMMVVLKEKAWKR